MLQELRAEFDKPMTITSGYRCLEHNAAIGGGPAHVLGMAVDVAIHGEAAYELIRLAFVDCFTGIGWRQHGPFAKRIVHLDNLIAAEANGLRPRIWSYPE